MANVKFNNQTYYVHSEKVLIGITEPTNVYKTASADTNPIGSVSAGQVFSILSESNHMYHIKKGWIHPAVCETLVQATNEVKALTESFVVKVISNSAIFTEPSINSHTATVLRVGDLERVVGESDDFFQLEHGGFIEKRGCRRY